ncbi:HDIG domain-containing protein [Clostridium sp. P21]|uniref:HDIG domain-containing protein n=1 Tax=Clostridium muellerianum TaxID=2716538 RepID=A0A7Y0EJV3_9CLOT|nr:HDIG domain-containing metalloprotein [Clostridium muellerianum]NMM64702.1 HDIG domain-containing protein [Clostridium muellerianum]
MKNLEEAFKEFDKHLLEDEKPSEYFSSIVETELFKNVYPLTLLSDLIQTPQSPLHHSEGSVWNHTMLVIDEASKRKDKSEDTRVFMWAALLHDLGKAPTTKRRKGKITSYDHDIVGEKLSIDFLQEFGCSEDFIKKVSYLVRWHMQTLFVVKNMPFANIKDMVAEGNFKEVALLSLCDRLGRGGMTAQKIKEEKNNVRNFSEKCRDFVKKFSVY